MIRLEKVSFSYTSRNNLNGFSLPEVNLIIPSGDFISIMGPNGSGKSTLLKIIANLLVPQYGKVFYNDRDVKSIPRKEFAKQVAFVPQNTGVFFPYSVYETVMMGRTPHLNYLGFESIKDHRKVMDILELMEIANLKNKGINEISGGESQRALIARALVQEPKVLLLDEPNAHLDIKHQVSIFNLLKKFNKVQNLTIIIISHDLNLTYYFSDRVILMKEGKILFDSLTSEVLNEENIKQVFDVNTKFINNQFNKKFYIGIDPTI